MCACSTIAQSLYTSRHDKMLRPIYHYLLHLYDFENDHSKPWHEQRPPSAVIIMWNTAFYLPEPPEDGANKVDMAVSDIQKKEWLYPGVSSPAVKPWERVILNEQALLEPDFLLLNFISRQKHSSRNKRKEQAQIESMQREALAYLGGLEELKIIGTNSRRSLWWVSDNIYLQNTFVIQCGRPLLCHELNKSALLTKTAYHLKRLT